MVSACSRVGPTLISDAVNAPRRRRFFRNSLHRYGRGRSGGASSRRVTFPIIIRRVDETTTMRFRGADVRSVGRSVGRYIIITRIILLLLSLLPTVRDKLPKLSRVRNGARGGPNICYIYALARPPWIFDESWYQVFLAA